MKYIHKILLALLQQCPVLLDLLLQAGFYTQQHLVLLALSLHLTADAAQLLLNTVYLCLDLLEQEGVARLSFCQGVFQRGFLKGKHRVEEQSSTAPCPCQGGEGPQILPTYRAELCLQLDLQVLHLAPQLAELLAAGLDVLAAGSDLLIDFLDLQSQTPETLAEPQGSRCAE